MLCPTKVPLNQLEKNGREHFLAVLFQLPSESEEHAETFFYMEKTKVEARERQYLELQRETALAECQHMNYTDSVVPCSVLVSVDNLRIIPFITLH